MHKCSTSKLYIKVEAWKDLIAMSRDEEMIHEKWEELRKKLSLGSD
jgi:hypothetical protein